MKKRILVLEHDEAILEIVSHIFKDEGYEVIAVNTGSNILEDIESYKPGVVLLDIIKPTEEGMAVCRIIKADPKTKHIPVIVYSTHPKVIATIKEICADEIIPKPFDVAELVNAVEMQFV